MGSIAKIEIKNVQFATDPEIACPAMVCSHERSGTHFLINSITKNSQFRNDPWVDYDYDPFGSFHNFHDRNAVKSLFAHFSRENCASIIKSHFAAPFFLGQQNEFLLAGLCKTLYIARNPIDVMLSFRRYVEYCTWSEGPLTKNVYDFFNSVPQGRMLRYQYCEHGTILERWRRNFLGWFDVAAANPEHVLMTRYEDLDSDHANETRRVLRFLGRNAPDSIARPSPYFQIVYVPPAARASPTERERLRQAIVEKLGPCKPIEQTFPELYR